jgi:hypothetical protein
LRRIPGDDAVLQDLAIRTPTRFWPDANDLFRPDTLDPIGFRRFGLVLGRPPVTIFHPLSSLGGVMLASRLRLGVFRPQPPGLPNQSASCLPANSGRTRHHRARLRDVRRAKNGGR